MIVSFIIGSSHSSVNEVSLVNGKIEDQLPDGPERNRNNGEDDSSENFSSSLSGILGEEVDHEACGESKWDQEKEGNENEPPWKVFI